MEFGRFDGVPTVTFLDDGRRVQLAVPFGFVDAQSTRWDVPVNAIVDGASIPKALWTIMGGPFEGKYRSASIIHDWYCDLRSRPWEDVHRVFYEAMRAAGVNRTQALLMYGGVYWGGPRWSKTVVANTNLLAEYLGLPGTGTRRVHYPYPAGEPEEQSTRVIEKKYRYRLTEADFNDLKHDLETHDATTPEEVSRTVDERLQMRSAEEGETSAQG